ncbi:MAG: hypothetical protein RL369_566, partial [Pseudomonadota bacterium]
MANMQLNQDRERTVETATFRMVFALGFVVVLAIALVGSLTGMPWRSWL